MSSLQGHLLIAAPDLADPNFFQTVVLLVQDDEGGALGLVLNRMTDLTIAGAWSQVRETPCWRDEKLGIGGPCEAVLMVLHTDEEQAQLQVRPGLCFSATMDDLEVLVQQSDGPMRFFIGYAGWAPGQLAAELEAGSWITLPASLEDVFESSEDQWDRTLRVALAAREFPHLSPRIIPRDPSHN